MIPVCEYCSLLLQDSTRLNNLQTVLRFQPLVFESPHIPLSLSLFIFLSPPPPPPPRAPFFFCSFFLLFFLSLAYTFSLLYPVLVFSAVYPAQPRASSSTATSTTRCWTRCSSVREPSPWGTPSVATTSKPRAPAWDHSSAGLRGTRCWASSHE